MLLCHKYLIGRVPRFPDAVLSCMFHTEKEQNPRIEWKKKGKDVSFMYFDGHFRGESAAERPWAPPQVVTWSEKADK